MLKRALHTSWLRPLLVGALLLGLNAAAQAQSLTSKAAKDSSEGFGALEEPTRIINKRLAEAWEANKITPADRCDDYEFIRRASLDVIGRIAKVSEIETYMKDPASTRRRNLIERLLKSPEYQKNWATMWTNWLMTRTGPRLYRDQIHLWLEETFESDAVSIKDMAEKLVTATGKTNDNGAVNYILAHLGGSTLPQGRRGMAVTKDQEAIFAKFGEFDMVPVTARTVRLFLGYQVQCTQCHDHPFNADWKQKHFWGVNAFFRQTERVGTPQMQRKKGMPDTILTLKDNDGFNKSGIIFYEKRNGVFLPSEAVFLDGTRLPKKAEGTRREQLANYLTKHPNFAKAYVNRMWGHLFSRGMNAKPAVDDFGEHNEVVHDELLKDLGDAFIKANYNPKELIRWIAASDAYNLKPIANKSNDSNEAEPYVSRMMLKAMSPEQLLESMLTATQPGGKDDEASQKFREDWMRRLTANFGDDEGNEITYNGTVVQALLMMNGRDVNAAIGNANSGTVQHAMKLKSPKAMMDYLFLATLNRPATQKEYTAITSKLALKGAKDTEKGAPLQDVFWALLNCNEFILNH